MSMDRVTFEFVPHPRFRGDRLFEPQPRHPVRSLLSGRFT